MLAIWFCSAKLCLYIITHFASVVKRISHERVRKMIKPEAFLMCTTAQEDLRRTCSGLLVTDVSTLMILLFFLEEG